jgi:IclR family pca regulon transcriptional regulator
MKPPPEPSAAIPPSKRAYRVEALARGLAVLSTFNLATAELSLAQIVASTGLSKSTAFRILRTLEEAGYLTRNAETLRYRPGLKVLELGFTALSSLGLRDVARPFLERLSRETGETVSLSLLDGLEVVYIDRVRNQSIVGVVLELGSRIPAHCASMGKAMLAHLPTEDLAALLEATPLAPCTTRSIVDPAALERELARIRRRGYAINDQELEAGLRAVAAPIRNHSGGVVAAINTTGSVRTISRSRLTQELAPKVGDAANRISRALGFARDAGAPTSPRRSRTS